MDEIKCAYTTRLDPNLDPTYEINYIWFVSAVLSRILVCGCMAYMSSALACSQHTYSQSDVFLFGWLCVGFSTQSLGFPKKPRDQPIMTRPIAF